MRMKRERVLLCEARRVKREEWSMSRSFNSNSSSSYSSNTSTSSTTATARCETVSAVCVVSVTSSHLTGSRTQGRQPDCARAYSELVRLRLRPRVPTLPPFLAFLHPVSISLTNIYRVSCSLRQIPGIIKSKYLMAE